MRNLIHLGRTRIGSSLVGVGQDDLPITALAPIAHSESEFYVTRGPTASCAEVEVQRFQDGKYITIASWPINSSDSEKCDAVIDFRYLTNDTVCCILSGGDIVLVKPSHSKDEEPVEIIGNVEGGILAAQWTTDEETLAIATNLSKLLFMTSTFEMITEITLSASDITQHINQVSVGWGRSQTQFRGLRAKDAPRDPTLPENVDQGVLSPLDDRKVRLHWRGDGECLALSRIEMEEGKPAKRIVRVYAREGEIDSFSEPIDGLEGALHWRPSGHWIATVQRRGETETEVVFLERNGLRHGGFQLRKPLGAPVREVTWNADSSILAVSLEDRIQLWMSSNYQWQLKREIIQTTQPYTLIWHPEKPFIFFVHTSDTIDRHELVLDLCKDSCTPPFDYGQVAVIDGDNLKLTPLRISNVPPPMSANTLQLASPAIHVSFNTTGQHFAILREGVVDIATWTCWKSHWVDKPEIIFSVKLDTFFDSEAILRQIVLIDENTLAIVGDTDYSSSTLLVLHRRNSSEDFEELHCLRGLQRIIRLFSMELHILCEMADGSINDVESILNNLEMFQGSAVKTSITFPTVAATTVGDQRVTFGLTSRGKLYIDRLGHWSEILMHSTCSSFLLIHTHLLLTTHTHLKTIPLPWNIESGIEIPRDDIEDERIRQIEHGSKLVTAMPSMFSIVLQAPRGNLETVCPRALVLGSVRHNLNRKEFRTAFLTCRTHRIDLNVLWTYDEELFFENVGLFVQQIHDVEYIDLFLSSLKEPLSLEKAPAVVDGKPSRHIIAADDRPGEGKKVSAVCDAILAELLANCSSTHTQSILTAHLSKIPPDIPSALRVIAELKDSKSPLLPRAIEHICFLADVNKLYDEALGLYRLDITLLIAQKSQKDPREYLPFLRSLNEMETNMSRFTIDDYLKRYSSALMHLSKCSPTKSFDDVLAYVKKHKLFKDGMKLYNNNREQYDAVLRGYADDLAERNLPAEAALAYQLVGEKENSLECYIKAAFWKEALNIASSMPLSTEELSNLAYRLADALMERGEYTDAARLYIDYGSDEMAIAKAVKALAKAYQFSEAIRLVNGKVGATKVAEIVHPAILECFAQTTELLSDLKGQIGAQVPRLRVLRGKKAEDPDNYFEGNVANDFDAPDDISVVASEATTSASLFTRYTPQSAGSRGSRSSSKNRRREERKRARGKKGTIYEEEYLVNSIARLMQRVNEIRGEVERLIIALVSIDKKAEATEVNRNFVWLVEEIRRCAPEVLSEATTATRVTREGVEEVQAARDVPVVEPFTAMEWLF